MKITEEVFEHKIPTNVILNFDQTPLGFVIRKLRIQKKLPKYSHRELR